MGRGPRLLGALTLGLALSGGCGENPEAPGGSDGGGGGGGGTGGNSQNPPSCLAAGTLVATPSGARPIEDLRVGDRVVSLDHETGRLRENTVIRVRSAEREVGAVATPEGVLYATKEHPFFDASLGTYIEAEDLTLDTRFVSLGRGWDAPQTLQGAPETATGPGAPFVPLGTKARVHDLEVARDHNYFAAGVLVHNKTGGAPPMAEGPCTGSLSETVCSGDVEVFAVDDFVRAVRRLDADSGTAGEGGTGPGEVAVAFELCPAPPPYDPTDISTGGSAGFPNLLFVAPEQTVSVRTSLDMMCDDTQVSTLTASATGELSLGTGQYAEVLVPIDEFRCLYRAAVPVPELCAD